LKQKKTMSARYLLRPFIGTSRYYSFWFTIVSYHRCFRSWSNRFTL